MKYYLLLLGIILLFFNQIFFGKIPFPGDLLVSTYEPYRSYPVGGFNLGSAVPSKLQGADVVRHIFPWKSFSSESLKKGEIPFWDPHNFSGNPLMSNFQSAVFYPINVIFFILPFVDAWTLYILLIPILSSFFTYLFLRELKLSNLASIFGGVAFASSSYMIVWMEWGNISHTFLWLPLALFLTEKIINSFKTKYIIFLILTLTTSLLAGYIQIYFYMTLVLFFYFFVKTLKKNSKKNLIIYLLALIFPVVFSLFQILPTIDLFNESSRFAYKLSKIQSLLNPWWYLITAIVPNFFGNPATNNHWFPGTYIERVSYIGLIPFTLFVYALLNFRKRIEIAIFGAISVFSLFLATDLFVTKYFFTIPFPIISTTVPTRILSLFQFGAVILSAIGLDLLKTKLDRKSFYLSTLLVFAFIIISWIFTFFSGASLGINFTSLEVARKNLILPTILFTCFAVLSFLWIKTKQKVILYFFLLVTVFDLFYFFDKITPFSSREFVYPQTPVIDFIKKNAGMNRFWGYGSGYIESDFQTFDKTFSPDGVDPIHIKRYTRLLESATDGKLKSDLPRPDANVPKGFSKEDLSENKYRQRLLNLLGVKYVLHKLGTDGPDYETFPESIYKFIYHDGHYQIYENKEALPRIFLAGNYVVQSDRQKILDILFSPEFDLRKSLVLEETVPSMIFSEDPNSQVKIKNYGNNKVIAQTSSQSNTLLFLSDTHFYGWQAEIDGKPAKIYRADYAFRAVPLKAGRHEVIFRYESKSFERGSQIAIVAFILLLGGLFITKKRKFTYEKN